MYYPPSKCGYCGAAIPERVGWGRRREYCKPGCREMAYRKRRDASSATARGEN